MLRLGPLQLHWSLLLGAALFCALQPRPLLLVGYAAVLLAHVAGHAFTVLGTRLSVSGVFLHALGGELVGNGQATPLRRSAMAAAGIGGGAWVVGGGGGVPRLVSPALGGRAVRRHRLLVLLELLPPPP